mmetsp:Transcript_23154/g.37128  ORF Transcript_23154/g.37128 Transcript_23154/m.37128 type:complete len:85 (+) Transcript_23154:74-328(+)
MQLMRALKAETRSKKTVGIWCGCAFQPCENDSSNTEDARETYGAKTRKAAGSRGGRVGEREGRGEWRETTITDGMVKWERDRRL